MLLKNKLYCYLIYTRCWKTGVKHRAISIEFTISHEGRSDRLGTSIMICLFDVLLYIGYWVLCIFFSKYQTNILRTFLHFACRGRALGKEMTWELEAKRSQGSHCMSLHTCSYWCPQFLVSCQCRTQEMIFRKVLMLPPLPEGCHELFNFLEFLYLLLTKKKSFSSTLTVISLFFFPLPVPSWSSWYES